MRKLLFRSFYINEAKMIVIVDQGAFVVSLKYLLLVALSSGRLMAATGERITIATPTILSVIATRSGSLKLGTVEDRLTHVKLDPGEAFVLVLADGTEIRSSTMKLSGPLKTSVLLAD